jgi:hypothetical protein
VCITICCGGMGATGIRCSELWCAAQHMVGCRKQVGAGRFICVFATCQAVALVLMGRVLLQLQQGAPVGPKVDGAGLQQELLW